mmetsp:Transcript_27032/g.37453  ORF Transcript_27032/g.37453 Transcript_27032/m.37453 type:complete len:221 (-) Transcript_27032:203-865(-)
MLDRLLGRKKVPISEQVKEWTKGLRKESRGVERKIREIRREEDKIKRQIKKLAKDKNSLTAIKTLAKGLVQSNKTCDRLYQAKAQINSVSTQLKLNYAQMKVAETMEKSGEIMKTMGQLMRLPELQANCKEFAKQMMKAGIIEEVVADTFEQLEDPDVDELADKEVNKVIFEITEGQFGKVESIKDDRKLYKEEKNDKVVEDEKDEDVEEMKKRLEQLNS